MESRIPELHSCPFCGQTVLKVMKTNRQHHQGEYKLYVRCLKCGARGPIINIQADDFDAENQAAARAWNTRNQETPAGE